MHKSQSESYKAAGVDITAGYKSVELIKKHVQKTHTPGVLSGLGGFGGLFEIDLSQTPNPVLVSGTDGVGTKLRLAFLMDKHDTVGIDCVAMCVNDIICAGAKPLIFLDYIACGKNVPEKIEQIVKGVAEGCTQADCALIGGETAEMPGFYAEDEYDIAGFSTGVADKTKVIDNSKIKPGMRLIALPSSGVHSNGFSLVRKVFGLNDEITAKAALGKYSEQLNGKTLGEALLEPTVIYVKPVLALLKQLEVYGVSHITGGGFYENIPRSLPKGCSVKINKDLLKTPPIFDLIQKTGNIPERDMFNTFNMGVGMCLIVNEADCEKAVAVLNENGTAAYALGEIIEGEDGLIIDG